MPLSVFSIQLGRPSKMYHSGEMMTGWVFLQVTSNEQVRSVKLTFTGGEHTLIEKQHQVTERHGDQTRTRTETRTYRDRNLLANWTLVLFGDASGHSRYPLIAGRKYCFPFQMPVPPNCATSCYLNRHAYVSYVLHAEVDRPWAFDYNAYETPVIIQPVDCNRPDLLLPRQAQKDHEICCWPCSQGHVLFSTEIPYGSYSAGERVPIAVDVNNQTKRQIPRVDMKLIRIWTYRAQGHVDRFTQVIDRQSYNCNPEGRTDCFLNIPYNLDVTSFQGQLISLEYFMQTELVIDGSCTPNTREEIPVFIGSIPRAGPVVHVPMPNQGYGAQGASYGAAFVSQDQMSKNEIAPPAYEAKDGGGEVNEWPVPPPAYNENVHNVKLDDVMQRPVGQAQGETWQ